LYTANTTVIIKPGNYRCFVTVINMLHDANKQTLVQQYGSDDMVHFINTPETGVTKQAKSLQ